jgi:hypothetical protein
MLAERDQRVMIVGYHAFDVSQEILALAERFSIPFIDAEKEQLPKGLEAPSQRDLLFISKADLLVTLWDGYSSGIRRLIRWYQEHGKDHIVAFAWDGP